MNCDDAFDCLTDPACDREDELTAHLEACPRCRQMREVLEPALELLRPASAAHTGESIEEELTRAPFVKSGNAPILTPETIRLAQNAAARLNRGARQDRVLLRRMMALSIRYTTALAIGACVAFGVVGLSGNNKTSNVAAASCLWSDAREPEATLEVRTPVLVSACVACHLERSAIEAESGGDSSTTACLWQLAHGRRHATGESVDRSAARGVVVSCVACHLEKAEGDDSAKSAALIHPIEDSLRGTETARIVSVDRMRELSQWPVECVGWVNRVVVVAIADRTPARVRAS